MPVKGLNGPNGFALDKEGRLYIANEAGKMVVRVLNDSITESVLTCDSPDGLTFDDAGNLYITNFFSGVILKKSFKGIDTFAKGLDKPADIKWDGKGNLFVSEYEKGSIKRINAKGEVTVFADGFKNPFGLVFDKEGNLYAASNVTGEISKINAAGTVSLFAQIPGAISYLAYSKKTGNLYAACFTCHNVYVVSPKGDATRLSGNGTAGYKDGSLREAQFKSPNSIVMSPDGSLYISEIYDNRIRKLKVE